MLIALILMLGSALATDDATMVYEEVQIDTYDGAIVTSFPRGVADDNLVPSNYIITYDANTYEFNTATMTVIPMSDELIATLNPQYVHWMTGGSYTTHTYGSLQGMMYETYKALVWGNGLQIDNYVGYQMVIIVKDATLDTTTGVYTYTYAYMQAK